MQPEFDLGRIVARRAARELLDTHAALSDCALGIFGPDGDRLAGSVVAEGFDVLRGVVDSCPVEVLQSRIGYVVAKGTNGRAGRADLVARHVAMMLSELCSREYELNDLSREILSAYEELNLFYDLAAELAGASDAESISEVIVDKAMRATRAARGWMLLAEADGTLKVAASRDLPGDPEPLPPRRGLAGHVVNSCNTNLVEDVRLLAEGTLLGPEACARRSLITVAVYVPGSDRPSMGVLQLADPVSREGGQNLARPFTAQDGKLAQALATQGAILMEYSRLAVYEREIKIARTIQQSLLPGEPPRIPGLDVAGACEVASNVGGDYYDHVPIEDGRLGLLLTDVSGHNLAAALMQTAARSTFRAAMLAEPSPLSVLRGVNHVLFDDLSRAELFLTAWIGCIDPVTGELFYGDAGHNPAMLYRKGTGTVDWLSGTGVPIGVMRDGLYSESSTRLEPGDVLVVYTDGLTEARPPGSGADEDYGEERLAATLVRSSAEPAKEIVRLLLEDVERYAGGGPRGDDQTLLVLKLEKSDSR